MGFNSGFKGLNNSALTRRIFMQFVFRIVSETCRTNQNLVKILPQQTLYLFYYYDEFSLCTS